ncbi:MAG: hypothetical protein KGL95_08635, partial [Patescibacteria group bacterium]|nr:hypothetical protein [Patescibacteria group bacterium]
MDIQGKRPDVPQNYLDAGNFFSNIIKRAPIFDSKMKNIVKHSREFIPILDKLYTIVERRNLQDQFRKSVKNALNAYGLFENPSSELTDTINTFSTPSNLELDWVNESAPKISFAFENSGTKIDENIIKVVYYDYTNSDYLADAWNEVLEKKELLKQFAYLLASRTLKINVSGSYGAFIELLEKLSVFRLSEFQKNYYEFFVEFKRRKTHMKTAVAQMGFDPEVVTTLIENFVPSTLNKDVWDEELAKEVCDKFDLDSSYLLLFYYDRVGFERVGIQTWNEIRDSNDTTLFQNFIKKLDSKNLLKIPEPYRKNLDMPTFKKISNEIPKFDFYKFNELVYSKFRTFDETKNKVIHVLESINPEWLSSEFRNNLKSFVPPSDDILTDIANYVEKESDVDHDLLLLFYG